MSDQTKTISSRATKTPRDADLTSPTGDIGASISGTPEEGQKVTLAREDSLRSIFGTEQPLLAEALLNQCIKVLKGDEASDEHPANDERKFMLSAVCELAPSDTVERMLAVQMAATHVAMIRAGRWLAHADTIDQMKAHYSGYNKLARTFAAQTEALRKHRNGGNQTVTVQHVNVEDGGQAIVGNVQAGGGGKHEN